MKNTLSQNLSKEFKSLFKELSNSVKTDVLELKDEGVVLDNFYLKAKELGFTSKFKLEERGNFIWQTLTVALISELPKNEDGEFNQDKIASFDFPNRFEQVPFNLNSKFGGRGSGQHNVLGDIVVKLELIFNLCGISELMQLNYYSPVIPAKEEKVVEKTATKKVVTEDAVEGDHPFTESDESIEHDTPKAKPERQKSLSNHEELVKMYVEKYLGFEFGEGDVYKWDVEQGKSLPTGEKNHVHWLTVIAKSGSYTKQVDKLIDLIEDEKIDYDTYSKMFRKTGQYVIKLKKPIDEFITGESGLAKLIYGVDGNEFNIEKAREHYKTKYDALVI